MREEHRRSNDPIQKMSLKLQHFDSTTCFHSFTSLKNSNCSINPSVSVVSVKNHKEHNSQAYHKQDQQLLLETPLIFRKNLSLISPVIENPDEKSRKSNNFGVNHSPNSASHDGKCCPVKISIVEADGNDNFGSLCDGFNHFTAQTRKNAEFIGNVNGKAEKGKNCGAKPLPVGGDAPKNWHTPNSPTQNGNGRAFQSRKGSRRDSDEEWNHKRGRNRSELAVKQMNARSSMKCLHYRGRIPALLEALDGFSDLDVAFMPWKKGLNNKEMSIILKEQLMWERAVEIFEWFKRNFYKKVNAIHYNIMFRILGEARRWDEVEKLWGELGQRRIQPVNSTYGTLIDVYRKGGDSERAVKWLEMMISRGIEPDEVTMGIVVQMYKKMGDLKKAEEFFIKWALDKRIKEGEANGELVRCKNNKVLSIPRSCLSLYTYNNIIDAYGKTGKVEEACKTFEHMIREGIMPTTVTFNIMIHMYGKCGQQEKVVSLLKQMKDLQCSPDTRTYSILIHLHAKHNDLTTATKYFKEMRQASLEPDIVSYRTLLYAFSLKHMLGEAEELILEMNKKGFEIDEFTQSAVTRMYVEAGMLESAWFWFQRFHCTGNMTSLCYSANIDAFGEHGHVVEAEKVFNCCRERNKLSVLEFNVMIKAYGISKRCDKACWLFDLMEQYSVVPDRCSYNTLIQKLAGSELPHLAIKYVRKMQKAGLVDDCIPYCAVISSFAKLGKLEAAMGLYEEMTEYGILPDVVLYGVIMNASADAGSIKEVTRCLDSMRSKGIPLNAIICSSLIKLYTNLGYLEEAQKTYQLLQSFDSGPNTYSSNCMIDLYSRLSMVRQAETIFQKLKSKKQANEFSYAMMLCMYKRNGMFMEAVQVAEKMKELGILTDLLSYNNVLSLYASDGRYMDAAETFNDMLVSAIKPDNFTFKALGIILLKCGVSQEEIAELELLRQDDAQVGLEHWKAMVSSVLETSDSACTTR